MKQTPSGAETAAGFAAAVIKQRDRYFYRNGSIRPLWKGIGKGAILGIGVAYTFYRSAWGLLVLPFCIVFSVRSENKKATKQQKERTEYLFSEFLGYMQEGLSAGAAAEQAVSGATRSLLSSCKKEEMFLEALFRMNRRLQLGVSLEEAFEALAEECDCEEMRDFSDVLSIAKRTGGAVSKIICDTERVIGEKQQTLQAIRTSVYSRIYENRLMKLMPFAIILYMQIGMPGFLDPLYHNLFGICLMSASLLVYLALCLCVDRLSEIDI